LSSLQTSCTQEDTQKYFWDSFDLNGDNAPQGANANDPGSCSIEEPLGAVGGDPQVEAEHPASSSGDNLNIVRSPDSKVINANQNTIQRILKTNGPIDSTRDIETLPEDFGHDARPRETNTIAAKDNDNNSNASDDEPQFGSVYPTNVGAAKAPSTSFEQLLASNDDINFADEEDDEIVDNDERPNSYDYHLHLNNYLPQHNISEASETDEQTPMLSRHPLPNLLNNGFRSPNANTTSRVAGMTSFYKPQMKTNRGNGMASFNPDNNGADNVIDLNQSISALPELENESVITNSDLQFSNHPLSNIAHLKSAIPPPASLSSDGHSTSNGILRPLTLNTTNGEDLFTASRTKDLDNLCELEDSDCETPTVSDTKTMPSSTPRVTRV
jgi:hypothetical protein